MSIKATIRDLEKIKRCCQPGSAWRETIGDAIALLKTHPDNQPNEPLTLEELRGMDGCPVWVKARNEDDFCAPHGWAIVILRDGGDVQLDFWDGDDSWLLSDDDGEPEDEEDEIAAVYRRPPEEGTP